MSVTTAEYIHNLRTSIDRHQITRDELAALLPDVCLRHGQSYADGALVNGQRVCSACIAPGQFHHLDGAHGDALALALGLSEGSRIAFLWRKAVVRAHRATDEQSARVEQAHAAYWRSQMTRRGEVRNAHHD